MAQCGCIRGETIGYGPRGSANLSLWVGLAEVLVLEAGQWEVSVPRHGAPLTGLTLYCQCGK